MILVIELAAIVHYQQKLKGSFKSLPHMISDNLLEIISITKMSEK